jgi:hypothetical protein
MVAQFFVAWWIAFLLSNIAIFGVLRRGNLW